MFASFKDIFNLTLKLLRNSVQDLFFISENAKVKKNRRRLWITLKNRKRHILQMRDF